MKRRLPGLPAAAVLSLCLTVGGCTRADDSTSTGGKLRPESTVGGVVSTTDERLNIAFRSEPEPPEAGENSIEVTVKQPDGSPVADATVTTVFSMPAMPSMNMPAMRSATTLVHEASGRYRGTGQLPMAGTWNVMVTVSRGTEELGTKNFSVIAK